MKYLLIALNVFLVLAIGHLALTFSSKPAESESETPAVQHSRVDKKKTNVSLTPAQKAVQDSPAVTEQKIAALVERNIFNTERVPEAPANRNNRNAQQQIRAEMRLVGTFTVGDSIGAIILQRLQGNSQQQLRALQQKEYEQYAASATRVTDPKKKSSSEGKDGEDDAAEDDDPEKKTVSAGNVSVSANNVFRQYLKIGDTTVTGYKLVEVTKTSAVLTKNSERIELTLLQPSEANNFARQQNNNNNNRNNNNRNNNNNNDRNNNQQANNNNRNNNNANRNNQQANNNNRNNNNRNNNSNRNNNNNRNNNR